MTLDYIVCGIRTYSMCALVFRRGEACSVARGAGAASDGASARGSRPGVIHDPLRHTLDARDLDPARECGLRAREDRLVVLGLNGVGVAVEGSGVRVRLELREGVKELVEVLVHTPACFDCEDRGLSFFRPRSASSYFRRYRLRRVLLLSKVIFKGKAGQTSD